MNTANVQIQGATCDDLENVQQCARRAYAKYIKRIGREPAPMLADFAARIDSGEVFIANVDGLFAGYVVFYREADHLHLENVAVDPSRSGNGIGKLLIGYVEQSAKDQGCVAVELYTNEAMVENLQMYPRLGYTETHRRWQDGFKRVFFRKEM